MAKRVAIFGSAGQLGVELVRVFSEAGYALSRFTRADLDIIDASSVEKVLIECRPDVVINSAAYNMVDVAEREPQAAYQVNGLAVRNMALVCRQLDAKFIHFSTDYVFDGSFGRPLLESDPVHPLGAYGVSKLAGELYAQAYLDNALLIRTCGVYGPGGLQTARGNFVETMLRLGRGGQPIRVVEDHIASPTYSPALALRTRQMLEAGLSGVFHIGGGVAISWYDYARVIFKHAGLSPELKPTNEREYRTPARRPKFSALSNQKAEAAGIEPMPTLEQALEDYFRRRERIAGS